MERFVQFAQRTVKAVSGISPFPISLSDKRGYIIGDTNAERIGTLHTPSIEVIKENRTILFDNDKISSMTNVLPGVAVPLHLDSQTIGVLGIIGNPLEVKPYAELIKKYVEMIWQETIHTHIEDLEAKTLESFVQYILLDGNRHKERVAHYCKVLQIEEGIQRLCIVINIGDSLLKSIQMDKRQAYSLDYLKKEILACIRKTYNNDLHHICTFLNPEKIILLKPITNDTVFHQFMAEFKNKSVLLIKRLHDYNIHTVSIAAGYKYDALHLLYQSYQEAEVLVEFASRLSIEPAIYSYYDWNVLMQLIPYQLNSQIQSKLNGRVEPFFAHDDFMELSYNFIVYCDSNLNISRAAKSLFIHRNTLIYRLKKIESITMLDLGCFEQCMLLYIIIKMKE